MISKLSQRITSKLISNGNILEEEKDLYAYGLFMLISHLFFFFISITFGIVFSCIFESLVFYLAFQFIRRYAGGYHASTEIRCDIMSTASILVCIMVIWLAKRYEFEIPLLFTTIISAVIIFIFCPLDTPEKPLTDKERNHYRKISLFISLTISALVLISFVFEWKFLFAPSCLSLILESILLIAGKVKKVYQLKNAK